MKQKENKLKKYTKKVLKKMLKKGKTFLIKKKDDKLPNCVKLKEQNYTNV